MNRSTTQWTQWNEWKSKTIKNPLTVKKAPQKNEINTRENSLLLPRTNALSCIYKSTFWHLQSSRWAAGALKSLSTKLACWPSPSPTDTAFHLHLTLHTVAADSDKIISSWTTPASGRQGTGPTPSDVTHWSPATPYHNLIHWGKVNRLAARRNLNCATATMTLTVWFTFVSWTKPWSWKDKSLH